MSTRIVDDMTLDGRLTSNRQWWPSSIIGPQNLNDDVAERAGIDMSVRWPSDAITDGIVFSAGVYGLVYNNRAPSATISAIQMRFATGFGDGTEYQGQFHIVRNGQVWADRTPITDPIVFDGSYVDGAVVNVPLIGTPFLLKDWFVAYEVVSFTFGDAPYGNGLHVQMTAKEAWPTIFP